MRAYKHLFSLLVAFAVCFSDRAICFPISKAKPLAFTLASADVIASATVIRYVPRLKEVEKQKQLAGQGIMDSESFGVFDQVNVAGTYTLKIQKVLKGKMVLSNQQIELALPAVRGSAYPIQIPVSQGDIVLLTLKRGSQGIFVAADSIRPLIVIHSHLSPKNTKEAELEPQALQLISSSLSSTALRGANTYILKDVVDSNVAQSLSKYLEDSNTFVKDNVLYGLASNQQVDVIPRIIQLAEDMEKKNGSGTASLLALENITTLDAVPYLNPLLFHHNEYVRLNAMFALQRLANQTSIPYLLLALKDPDSQNVIASMAYQKLHELVPALGIASNSKYFDEHRNEVIEEDYKWWKAEINGQHLTQDKVASSGKVAPVGQESNVKILRQPVASFGNNLFVPDKTKRLQAVANLQGWNSPLAKPYLLLALEDPDYTIAYKAYTVLYKLLPQLGRPVLGIQFRKNRELAVKPLSEWWQEELKRNDMQKSP